jgi:hypothetical protein
MRLPERTLLVIDGLINLLLGTLLLCFPLGIATVLGLPASGHFFYPSLLGAVLLGIGAALLIDAFGGSRGLHGLGLAGAIAINLCGAAALAVWLLAGSLALTTLGQLALWALVVILIGLSGVELYSHVRGADD